MSVDPWQLFGLEPGADVAEIKAAYRRLARVHHPDASGDGDGVRFQAITRAYQTLLESQRSGKGEQTQSSPAARAEVEISFSRAFQGGSTDVEAVLDGVLQVLTVEVPAGVASGRLVEARTRAGASVPVSVLVTDSSVYRRLLDPADLEVTVLISISEACLGARQVAVPAPDELVQIRIPAGSSSGRRLRLAGRGMPRPATADRGDLYVLVEVVVPTDLTPAQRRLFEELARYETNPRRVG